MTINTTPPPKISASDSFNERNVFVLDFSSQKLPKS